MEKPGNFWKILENIWTSETGFIPEFLFTPDCILNSRILPSRAPTNHPTILLDILCLANLNRILFFLFLGFCLNKPWENKHNKPVLGVISVRKKKHSEQRMRVHMVKYYSISNTFKCDWWEKRNNLGGKRPNKNHNTNYHNIPVVFQVWLVLEISKF